MLLRRLLYVLVAIGFLFASHVCAASEKNNTENNTGQVELPLPDYNNLISLSHLPPKQPRPAPAGYATGNSEVQVTVTETDDHAAWAEIEAKFKVEILEEDWVLVPLLPSGSALSFASVDGSPIQLVTSEKGLGWSAKGAAVHQIVLRYRADAKRFAEGFTLPVPLVDSSSATLKITLPGTGIDASILPAAGIQKREENNTTILSTTIPPAIAVQISWRTGVPRKVSISRAAYRGELKGESVIWKADLAVEVFADQSEVLKLMPSSVTLSDLEIDGKKASLFVEDNYFATAIKGKGEHSVKISFHVPAEKGATPSQIKFSIPEVPISRFELSLPGRKEVKVQPIASVEIDAKDEATKALAFVPMASEVAFTWTESAPLDSNIPLSANATLYQAFSAEEGILNLDVLVNYEITRGETNLFEFEIPAGLQINKISCAQAAIVDWQVVAGKTNEVTILKVFLERKVSGDLSLTLSADRGLSATMESDFALPIIRAKELKRQRGMLILLSNKDLMLQPTHDRDLLKVGENQIPSEVRNQWKLPVSHTYKYVEDVVALTVHAKPPERTVGRFDAIITTLVSLGDVSLTGSSTIEINMKSGSVEELQIALPPKVNFLGLTSPSLRTHTIAGADQGQTVNVQFTQEMDGQFTLELKYEHILSEAQSELSVPTPRILGAEIEQGKIAVEALSAVEVQAAKAEQLSSVDPSELPQQVVLKTTNPILLAYKYVQAEPPYKLALKVTRHRQIDIQAATIDEASYQTLFTADGIAVTAAHFQIRNAREQFLRLSLPADSEVWSLFVDGKPEKPALLDEENSNKRESKVLIKIINSAQGFAVDLVYRTRIPTLSALGSLEASLAQPEIVVTRTRWEAFLPQEFSYGRVHSNMRLVENEVASADELRSLSKSMSSNANPGVALQLQIPTAGVRFVFEKLYANQGEDRPTFEVSYSVLMGKIVGLSLVGIATILIWSGLSASAIGKAKYAISASIIGLLIIVALVGFYGVSIWPAFPASAAVAAFMYVRQLNSLKVLEG